MNTAFEVSQFLEDTLLLDGFKGDVLVSLREMALEIEPSLKEEIKYGGLVFISNNELIGGIFIRKKHISVEFSFGARMLDPDDLLEGTGKFRKHLKIFKSEDVEDKKVSFYMEQAFNL